MYGIGGKLDAHSGSLSFELRLYPGAPGHTTHNVQTSAEVVTCPLSVV